MNKRKPKSWSEWWNAHKTNYWKLFYYTSYKHIIPLGSTIKKANAEICRIKEFERLLALRNEWVGNWKDTESSYYAPYIKINENGVGIRAAWFSKSTRVSRLTFPTREMCEEFIEYFGPKIKKVLL